MVAEFIGMCAAFWVGAWARSSFESIWLKFAFFIIAWSIGIVAAVISGIAIAALTSGSDFAAAREAGRAIGVRNGEIVGASFVAAVAGLISSLGERLGIGTRRKSGDEA